MSILMNIATPTNQGINNALGVAVDSSVRSSIPNIFNGQEKNTSNEFASLIATLLGLTNPKAENSKQLGSTEAKSAQNQENILAQLGIDNTIDLQQISKINAQNENLPTNAISALSDLLKSLEEIGLALENGQAIDPKMIDKAIASINILSSELEAIMPTPIGKNIQMATSIYQALNINSETGLASLALQGVNSLSLQNQTQKNPLTLAANEIVGKLQSFAQNLGEASPKLSQEINNLINKFANNSNNNGNQNTNGQATSNQTALGQANLAQTNLAQTGLEQAVLANLNKVKNKNSISNQLQAGSVTQSNAPKIAADNILKQAVLSKMSNFNMDNNQALSDRFKAQQGVNQGNNIVANQNNTQSVVVSAAIKTDGLLQSDPTLTLQSNTQLTPTTGTAASIKPAISLYQPPAQNLNLPHIAFEFTSNIKAGINRFQIQLDPPEMGRIDVKIDIDKSGALNARLVVERADTLDLLQRDARALERALAQAGLDSNKTNLEFSLKDNPFAQNNSEFSSRENGFADKELDDEAQNETDIDIINQTPNAIIYRGTASYEGLNITA